MGAHDVASLNRGVNPKSPNTCWILAGFKAKRPERPARCQELAMTCRFYVHFSAPSALFSSTIVGSPLPRPGVRSKQGTVHFSHAAKAGGAYQAPFLGPKLSFRGAHPCATPSVNPATFETETLPTSCTFSRQPLTRSHEPPSRERDVQRDTISMLSNTARLADVEGTGIKSAKVSREEMPDRLKQLVSGSLTMLETSRLKRWHNAETPHNHLAR